MPSECRMLVKGSVGVEERGDGTMPRIVGMASVFYRSTDPGTEYELGEGYYERIMPSAFDRAISDKHDVRGLFNHDANCILGRTSSGTMRITKTPDGLRYEIDPPNTQAGRDIVESVRRGDVTGSSFSFVAREVRHREERGAVYREVHSVDLFDVGPVTFPAYTSASVGCRMKGDDGAADEELRLFRLERENHEKQKRDADARLLEIQRQQADRRIREMVK